MTRTLIVGFAISTSIAGFGSKSAAAACWCWDGFCSGLSLGSWTDVPGTTVTWATWKNLADSSNQIGSCPYAGATPPADVKCDATGATTEVVETALSGDLGIEAYGVSATIKAGLNVTATKTSSCTSPTTLTSWCTCCRSRSRVRFQNIYKCQNCSGSDWICTCSYTKCGTITYFDGVICDAPACTPPTPCTSTCPEL